MGLFASTGEVSHHRCVLIPTQQVEQTRQRTLNHRNTSGVIVMVSHYANIIEISGVAPQEGEIVVIRANPQGDLEVAGQKYFEINSIKIPKLRWLQIKGSLLGVLCPIALWNIVLKEILKETEYYLEVFCRLSEQATEQDKELFKYIVAHEVAIGQFAEIELVNSGDNSLDRIKALLDD